MNPPMARTPRREPSRPPQPAIPDRSLVPETTLATVAIRATGQHPFVFRKMVIGPVGPGDPQPGRPGAGGGPRRHSRWVSGSGTPGPRSRLRMLTREAEPPGPDVLGAEDRPGGHLRLEMLGLDAQANAYRVLHAEGDGLSGLIVDRFDDVLSVEVFSLGMYQRIGPILELCAGRLGTRHFRVQVRRAHRAPGGLPGPPRWPAPAPASRHHRTSTTSATGSTSRRGTRPASSATSATTAATWRSSVRTAPSLMPAATPAGSGSMP